jgi:formate dehydrogenase maturation protein FdhE
MTKYGTKDWGGNFRYKSEVRLSEDDKKGTENPSPQTGFNSVAEKRPHLIYVDREYLQSEVSLFHTRLQQFKSDFDFNAKILKNSELNITLKPLKDSRLTASEQREKLRSFIQNLEQKAQGEIASFFSFLRTLAPAEKKDNLENLLHLVEQNFDVTSKDFLKNMIDVVDQALDIIDKTPKQE